MGAKNITRDKLLWAGFESGTDMGDGRIEYYYQKVYAGGRIEKDFYLWQIDGKYILEMLWEGYESKIKIELESWQELEMLFFAIIREKLPLKNAQDKVCLLCGINQPISDSYSLCLECMEDSVKEQTEG